jgi:hypothetical protein
MKKVLAALFIGLAVLSGVLAPVHTEQTKQADTVQPQSVCDPGRPGGC